MDEVQLSTTEYAVLGLLGEGPTHGFALARLLAPEGALGRILTVRRPLIYRALDRLVELEYAEPIHREPGDSGPQRIIHKITPAGRRRIGRWLKQPVSHIRQMRIEFQLKLAILQRHGRSSFDLIVAQREALRPTLTALDDGGADTTDHLELWRQHNAAAAAAYLDHLIRLSSEDSTRSSRRSTPGPGKTASQGGR
jgi:PadR family transcriptional regulator AphA